MEPRSLTSVVEMSGGRIVSGSPETRITGVSTDSREVRAGDLFIALPGERFDGHDYAEDALQKGAVALLLEKPQSAESCKSAAVAIVENTRRALGQLAARYRNDFKLPVVAVGGSNGKTTTKELIASVLRRRFQTLQSKASYNNDIGVPLTLLRLALSHQAAVFEVGTNHPGELAPLVAMVQPLFSVITNIGREHLEFFGNLPGVVQEEGWLAELLPAVGKLFIDGDGEWTEKIVQRTRAGVIRVGMEIGNDWRASSVKVDGDGSTFRVDSPTAGLNGSYRVNLLGRHQAKNALFALAVGAELGLGREELQTGLTDCRPPKMRLELWETSGVGVLDDCYNANADSMRVALQTLRDLPCRGRRIAVLGDMAELGAESAAAHAEVGRYAAELGVAHLFAVGQLAAGLARAARDAGLEQVHVFLDVESAVEPLKKFVTAGDLILLKASRSMQFERLGAALRRGSVEAD